MKHPIRLVFFLILYSVQAQVLFEKDFASQDVQMAWGIIKNEFDNYVIYGGASNWTDEKLSGYLMKINVLGDSLKQIQITDTNSKVDYYVTECTRNNIGDYCLIGTKTELQSGEQSRQIYAYFYKQDVYHYIKVLTPLSKKGRGECIINTTDSGYIVGGQIKDITAEHYQPYIIKIDENGDKEWELIIEGYSDDNKVTDLLALPNGNFLASCLVNWQPWNSNNPSDIALIEFDESGIIIQQKLIDWEVNEVLWDLYVSDSDYIAAYNNQDSTYIMKLDLNFDVVWKSEEITNNCSIFQPMVLINGDIIASGCYRTNLIDYALQAQIIKLNSNGELLWRRLYGGEDNDYGYALLRDTDGTLWVTGRYESGLESVPVLNGQGDTLYFGGRANVYLLHTNCLGLLENPSVSFSTTADNHFVHFTADTLGFRGEPYSLWWDFGDGSAPEAATAGSNTAHHYAQDGVYWATLTAYFCDTLSVGQCIRIGTTEQCPEEWTVGNETMPPLTGNHIAATYTAADNTLHFWAELPPCEAQLYDVSGKMVEQAQFSGSRWQLPSLPQGVYFYRIFTQHSKTPLADGKFVAP